MLRKKEKEEGYKIYIYESQKPDIWATSCYGHL
jgi:hypothetical protein